AVIRLYLRHDHTGSAETVQDTSAATSLAWWLRENDIVAKYAPHDYEILLLHTTAEEADKRAATLAKRLEASQTHFELAVAAYPRDGRTPEALVEHTNKSLRRGPGESTGPVVATGALERMARVVERVAASLINVLILGETGVGKEVLAR